MFIKPSMIERETWDQCHLVMDWKGFCHDFTSIFLESPKYPKIKFEVRKKIGSVRAACWKYLFLNIFIKPYMIELET